MKDEDIVSLWRIAEQLDLVNLLDRVAGKRNQGYSVGLYTVLSALFADLLDRFGYPVIRKFGS